MISNDKALPLVVSSPAKGSFIEVMSLNVHRNSTTQSFSFRIGAICIITHNGDSASYKE